jgi:1,4-alpha-glucan branching enzyme
VVTTRLAIAASVAFFLLGGIAGSMWRSNQRDVGKTVPVTFVLVEPNSSRISVVGDFNDWRPESLYLAPRGNGVWTATVELEPGRYSYAFVVDGVKWRADPAAPTAVGEDFGRPSSVVIVEARIL